MGEETLDRKRPPKRRAKSVANSHTSPAAIEHQRKVALALELRGRGMNYRNIGAAMDIDPSYAFKLVDEGLAWVGRPAASLAALEFDRSTRCWRGSTRAP